MRKIKLLSKKKIARETTGFEFEKPSGFEFKPGQFVETWLADPEDVEDSREVVHPFSIASAPHEETLFIATRMRDTDYKNKLGRLSPGEEVVISKPMGGFVLHKDEKHPAAFLAGGIGITPLLSMLRYIEHNRLPYKIVLFYSNPSPKDTAFLNYLNELKDREDLNFRLVPTMTQTDETESEWDGETGRIDMEMLKKYLPEPVDPLYYVVGPPDFVIGMKKILTTADVPDDKINREHFTGY